MDNETESAVSAAETSPPSSAPADAPAAAPSTPPSTPTTSEPSSSEPGQSKQSLLDAVLKVVPATTEKDVLTPTKPPDPEPDKKPEDQDADDPDESPEDDEAPAPQEASPALRKRINKLLKQRRELRTENEGLRGSAQIGSELETFARTSNLGGDEIANGLSMMALLKAGDYAGFYKAISPFVRTAQEYLGIVLPPDLNARVKAGHMTEAAARDFARQRFDGQRAEFGRREAQSLATETAHANLQGQVKLAITNFETRLAASDADYKAKAPAVRRMAQAMLFERGGSISSVKEAIEITKAAYDEVNKQVRSYQPKPQPTDAKPNGSTQAPSTRAAPPTSLMEAALQGLENSRRAGG